MLSFNFSPIKTPLVQSDSIVILFSNIAYFSVKVEQKVILSYIFLDKLHDLFIMLKCLVEQQGKEFFPRQFILKRHKKAKWVAQLISYNLHFATRSSAFLRHSSTCLERTFVRLNVFEVTNVLESFLKHLDAKSLPFQHRLCK